jgi:ATP-dependent RNA helicase RhlE
VVAYGGVGMKSQLTKVKEGIDILTATPGRFMDLYRSNEMPVKDLKTLVLDEADKMMDMGFMPQINQILEVIPTKRQNLLFSATMPPKVITLSEDFLEFPTIIEVAPSATTADTVDQLIYEVPNLKTKMNLLLHLLQDETTFNRVLVFARTRTIANNVYKYLTRKFYEGTIRVIHANKAQNTRINAMEAFKAGEVRIMVATDVVSRGIDVSMVSHVINFDVPLVYEDYVHRIGRTGRASQTGSAISFVTMDENYHIGKIEQIIRQAIKRDSIPAEVEITETPFTERQTMLREIDNQKKKENPDFKGAFHEKKRDILEREKRKSKAQKRFFIKKKREQGRG